MAPRLKVFVTSDGLTDHVVAVSSKAKALAAWGVRQDLFKEGLARESDDEDLRQAALAKPGEVLRRAAGTRAQLKAFKAVEAPAKAGPTKAQVRRVGELEEQLRRAVAANEKAVAELERRMAELERRREDVEAAHAEERARLEAQLRAAKDALG